MYAGMREERVGRSSEPRTEGAVGGGRRCRRKIFAAETHECDHASKRGIKPIVNAAFRKNPAVRIVSRIRGKSVCSRSASSGRSENNAISPRKELPRWFLRLRFGSKQLTDQSKALGAVPVGKESKLANADEAVWKNMLHVAA